MDKRQILKLKCGADKRRLIPARRDQHNNFHPRKGDGNADKSGQQFAGCVPGKSRKKNK